MSKKNSLNEIALTATENFAKEIIVGSATSLLEDIAKSVPIASTALALTKAYSNYKTAKDQRQLLAFIQAADEIDDRFIERFFQNPNNTELGFEILGILDQTYLEKQAIMIFRATKLFKDQQIGKLEFNRYTYIITRLNNYLIHLVEEIFNLYLQRRNDPNQIKYPLNSINIQNPNMDLLSFGFLTFNQPPHWGDDYDIYLKSQYTVQADFINFYETIFKD